MHNTITAEIEKEGVGVELALEWTDSYHETTCASPITFPSDGGTHLADPDGDDPVINAYAQESGIAKGKGSCQVKMHEGLTAIISVKVPDPKFSSQTKDKLVSSEVRNIVVAWFQGRCNGLKKLTEARKIVSKAYEAAAAREVARKARADSPQRVMDIASLPGKLADCQEKDPSKSEIFLVEGDLAGDRQNRGVIVPIRPFCCCAVKSSMLNAPGLIKCCSPNWHIDHGDRCRCR